MKPIAFFLFFSLIVSTGSSSFGQGVRVGPNGEFSEQTLSLPYAFYNGGFGFAVGYVSQRFNAKAAVYYAAELRPIPCCHVRAGIRHNPYHDRRAGIVMQRCFGFQQ
jgi:hypothetical protein